MHVLMIYYQHQDYSEIAGVYASEAKAKKAANEYNNDPTNSGCAEVEGPFEVIK